MKDSGLKYVDLFFIDVEGAEYEVLKTIDWNTPIYLIVIELSDSEKDRNCRNLLHDKGYTFHKKVGLSEVWYDETYLEKRKEITE